MIKASSCINKSVIIVGNSPKIIIYGNRKAICWITILLYGNDNSLCVCNTSDIDIAKVSYIVKTYCIVYKYKVTQ